MIDLYKYFLERLLKKLSKHSETPQKEKISSFIYIISMMFSLIEFLNISKFEKYSKVKVLSIKDWSEIRAYYNLLLLYLDSSWSLMWDNNSYKGQITNQLSSDNDEIRETTVKTFEDYIIHYEYLDTIKELVDIALVTVDNFVSIQKEKEIDTGEYGLVKPKIFERDIYISKMDKIKNNFLNVMKKLSNYKNNLSTIIS